MLLLLPWAAPQRKKVRHHVLQTQGPEAHDLELTLEAYVSLFWEEVTHKLLKKGSNWKSYTAMTPLNHINDHQHDKITLSV